MSEQIMRDNLLVLAQTYANAKGWALTTVSKQIHGNQHFLEGFVAGEISVTVKTYHGMIDKFRSDWPPGAKWPITRDIPAPKRLPYREPLDLPSRGPGGKFLGKKIPKVRKS